MRTIESPGALAAHGASEIDGLGPHVFSQNNRQQKLLQAPIRAMLIGSNRWSAEGISARGYDPVFDLRRELVAPGRNPTSPLEGWRGKTLCLRVGSIGEGARLAVAHDRDGTPHAFDARQERSQGHGAGSPVAPNAETNGK